MGGLRGQKIDHKGAGGCAGAATGAGSDSRAQTGQMQRWPRSCAGRRASAARDTGVCMHQQPCGSAPPAMAHWLGWPQAGQVFGEEWDEGFMKKRGGRGLECRPRPGATAPKGTGEL
ncbi:MAG: hypothetical protein A3F76_17285 [Burkholderiales bacterium RIFCSPLOWO2_12_FULL_65_40]|nr:MAG: hypothetical protein A3F76_17285 [Burkholderiales bacterium RIFCSPLOWO2_12_FULL_65_40]